MQNYLGHPVLTKHELNKVIMIVIIKSKQRT